MPDFANLIKHLEERASSQLAESAKYRNYAENREKEARSYRNHELFHRNEAEAALAALADLRAKFQRIRLYGADPVTKGGV